MATMNATGGKTTDVRVPAPQVVKTIAATAQAASAKSIAKTPLAAPAVVVKINQAVATALPTYNAAGKTTAAAAKAPAPVKTLPQPAAAKSPAPAVAAKTAQPAAAPAKSPAPAAAAKPATPAPAAAAKTSAQSSGAQEAPAADGSLYATGEGSVKVDIMASDSGYENKIFWSADNWKTRNYLGVDNKTGSFDLGNFAKGTKIEFGIDNGQGDFFKTGGGNTDGFEHTRVSSDASGMTVGFEDLRGGGDQDFNDAIIRVGGLSTAQPAPTPVVVTKPTPAKPAPAPVVVAKPAPAPTKDNRSGLGDGTNPGNGDGRVNSPNKGTENPNQSKTVAAPVAKTPVTAVKTTAAKKV